MVEPGSHIILFDGVCNLCNGFVRFLVRHDRQARFQFASLQSEAGQHLLRRFGYPDHPLTSLVYVRGDRAFRMSAAVLQILDTMGGLWKVFGVFRLVPPGIRDRVYRFIARRRYIWFGKKDACMLPPPDMKHRFLS